MNRTIGLLMLAVLIGACSAGNGYNYIKPAADLGGSVSSLSDGSTKSVYVFGDPDEHRRDSQQRPVSYRQAAPQQRPVTYRQAAPQQRPVTYRQAAPQQRQIIYRQAAPQQRPVTYRQVVQQQRPITYSNVVSQQRPVTYTQVAPQQQQPISYSQIAPQQLPFTNQVVAQPITYSHQVAHQQQQPITYSQVVPQQQQPITYSQVIPQQQPIAYNQVAPQQQPISYNQVAPQQIPYNSNQIAPTVKQNLQVLFVKTPGYEAYTNALLKMAKEAIQTQTIVYVLSKEPDIEELTRRFKEIQATARKMPEVRFIKYKTDDEAVRAQEAIQAQYESLPGPSSHIGTQIGTEIGIGNKLDIETGSINPNYATSSITTSNEDDFKSESQPPFLPTGVDVVPGSSYLPPNLRIE